MTTEEKEYCEKCPIHGACAYVRLHRDLKNNYTKEHAKLFKKNITFMLRKIS